MNMEHDYKALYEYVNRKNDELTKQNEELEASAQKLEEQVTDMETEIRDLEAQLHDNVDFTSWLCGMVEGLKYCIERWI